jgi:hypothetical protein
MGSNAPPVFALEKISVENTKISAAQRKTGSQLRRDSLALPMRELGMGDYFTTTGNL